jgi:hypothetical protein
MSLLHYSRLYVFYRIFIQVVEGGEEYRTYNKKEVRLTGLVTSCVPSKTRE